MTDDAGRYLTDMGGLTHEVLGGDPEEIVLRVARVGEGARTLEDLATELRDEARRYERLRAGGWRLMAPFRDGEARCRKAAEGAADPAAPEPGPGPGAGSPLASPPERLHAVVEGAGSLEAAGARLAAAATGYERLADEGRSLATPVRDGQVPID